MGENLMNSFMKFKSKVLSNIPLSWIIPGILPLGHLDRINSTQRYEQKLFFLASSIFMTN